MVSREIPDYTLGAVHEFLSSVIEKEKEKEKKSCRGPFLAQLELEKLCKQECIYSKLGELLFVPNVSCIVYPLRNEILIQLQSNIPLHVVYVLPKHSTHGRWSSLLYPMADSAISGQLHVPQLLF